MGLSPSTTAILNPDRLGLLAFILMDVDYARAREQFITAVKRRPNVLEPHTSTGQAFFLMKTRTGGTADLNGLITAVSSMPRGPEHEDLRRPLDLKETSVLPVMEPPAV